MTVIQHTRRPRRSDVRSEILEAATACFLEHGYSRTNVADLAARAGYSKGAVYSNFGGKPELFGEVMNTRAAEFASAALAEFDVHFAPGDASTTTSGTASDESPDGTRELVTALTAMVLAERNWPVLMEEFRALAAEDEQLRAIYVDWRRRQRDQLADQIAARRTALGFTDVLDTQAAATLLMMVITSLELEQRAAPEITGPDVIAATLELALRNVIK